MPAHNIVLAIVGLAVVNSTFVLLLGICANVGLTFLNAPPSPIRKTLGGNPMTIDQADEHKSDI